MKTIANVLEKFTRLNHIVKILVPESDIARAQVYAAALSKVYGGCTITPGAAGTWVNERGELISDPIIILESYYQDNTPAAALRIARRVKRDYKQDAVSLISDDSLYLV